MPEPLVDDAIALLLAGVSGLGAPWVYNNATHSLNTIFLGPLRATPETPANAVFVMAQGGRAPMNFLGGRVAGSIYHSRVQIMVRSAGQDWLGGRALALAVRALIHKVAVSGYISCLAQESEPNYVGEDEARNHLFSLNFELLRAGTP
jgi:hypothetical protein